jgi:dynein heavy chain
LKDSTAISNNLALKEKLYYCLLHKIYSTEELFELIEDQIVTLQTMYSSPFIGNFLTRATQWKDKLVRIQTTLEIWQECQQHWVYFTSVFASADIQREMQAEARKYETVDQTWRKIMDKVDANPRVLVVCEKDDLVPQFLECNRLMDQALRALNSFLEAKRQLFPRFYFLSNKEVLDILAVNKEPNSIQPLLRKCFEGIDSLEFKDSEIVTMQSEAGEIVPLLQPVIIQQLNVEVWLLKLEIVMKATIRDLLGKAIAAHNAEYYGEWMMNWPAQVMLAANQVVFTHKVTQHLRSNDVKKLETLKDRVTEKLNHFTSLVRGKLSEVERSTITSLLVLEVHNRDIVNQLITNKVCIIFI